MLEANFWQDKNNSKKIIKEKKLYEDIINYLNNSEKKLKDLDDLIELALDEENLNVQRDIFQNVKDLRVEAKKMKLNVFYLMKQTL